MGIDKAVRVATGLYESRACNFSRHAAQQRRAAKAKRLLVYFSVTARPLMLQKIKGFINAIERSWGTIFQRDNHRGLPFHVVEHH